MKKTLDLLKKGFESSMYKTTEFKGFVRTFRSEVTKGLKTLGATDIKIGDGGHFCISGFFKVGAQWYYLSLSDVRGSEFSLAQGGSVQMLYRTAEHNKDFTGGGNQYVNIETDMFEKMNIN